MENNEITGATSERLVLGGDKSSVAHEKKVKVMEDGGGTDGKGEELIYAAFENARSPCAFKVRPRDNFRGAGSIRAIVERERSSSRRNPPDKSSRVLVSDSSRTWVFPSDCAISLKFS